MRHETRIELPGSGDRCPPPLRRALLGLAVAASIGIASSAPATEGAEPPSLLNYQGVLRDASNVPIDGSFNMYFRFFDAPTGGNQILVDLHRLPGPQVIVTGGLFDVQLGSGTVLDGGSGLPNGPYTSLGQMFRDFATVYMGIEISGETLSPRVRVVASAYALNADHLDGKDGSEYVDTSAAAQTKAGDLAVGGMSVGGGLDVGGQITIQGGAPGAGRVLTSSPTGLAVWQDLPAVQASTLSGLADRLDASDPSELPFATLRSFDCSGGKTASLLLTIGAGSPGTPTGFVGADRISDTSEYLVAVERNDTSLNTESLIGQTGRVILQRDGATTFFSGMVTEAGLAGWDGSTATYVFRLEPHLTLMSRSSGYETFTNSTVSGIIQSLLTAAGLTAAVVDTTTHSYELTMRYEETPLGFLNRITEKEGVHYHFSEGTTSDEVLFLTSNAGFTAIPGSFNYHGDLQDPGTGEEFVATFHSRTRQYSGDGRAAGWDDSTGQAVSASATAGGGAGGLQEFFADVDSIDLAVQRAAMIVDREQIRRLEHSGTGNVAHLKAGHTFTLNDLTTAGFGGAYVVTAVRHYAVSEPAQSCVSYGNAFTAIPSTVTYRPPRRTHPPDIPGPLTAIVTANEDPDKLGRVKVKFPLDPFDSAESGWIRIAHPSRLSSRRVIPEVNDEVLVDFVRGDPMVPVVIGALHNGTSQGAVHDSGEIYMVEDTSVSGAPHYGCANPSNPNDPCPQAIYFYDESRPDNEHLSWDDADDRFEFTNDLWITENLEAGGQLKLGGGAIVMDDDGPDATQSLFFFDAGSPIDEFLAWNDPADTFELSDDLKLGGGLDASGQLRGASLDVGTGPIFGGTLLDMGSGLIKGGDLLLTGTVQGATVTATGALSGGSTLALPGPISLNGANLSQSGGLFALAGGLSVGGDAGLTGDLTIGGGDINASTLVINSSSFMVLSGSSISINSASTIVAGDNAVHDMIDADNDSTAMSANWYHDGSFANASKLADLDEAGNLRVRGSLAPFVSFDIAESFLAAEPVEAGDLVRLDPTTPGAIRLTAGAGDPLAIGVVSERPGIILGGGVFDAASLRSAWGEEIGALYEEESGRLREVLLDEDEELMRELEGIESTPMERNGAEKEPEARDEDAMAARDADRADAIEARRALEERIEARSLARFYEERFAPVALAGRVPVKADASFGEIRPGDALTPSALPGVAMKADGSGPVIGTALEGLSGGRGKVLALVHRGAHAAIDAAGAASVEPAPASAVQESRPGASVTRTASPSPDVDIRAGTPFTIRRTAGSAGERASEVFRVDARGNVYARGALHPASMDLAEYFPVSEPVEPGDVLVVDPDHPGSYRRGIHGQDPAVIGVVSSEPGVLLGSGISRILEAGDEIAAELEEARLAGDREREEDLWSALEARFRRAFAPVALSGTVICKVDAGYGAIVPGDLLTTSPTPGHAMRADEAAPGTILGKALEPLDGGTGHIKVLVMLR